MSTTKAFGTFFLPGPTEVREEVMTAMVRPGRVFEIASSAPAVTAPATAAGDENTLIAVLVGSFIIHNTFTILVAQRGREVAERAQAKVLLN